MTDPVAEAAAQIAADAAPSSTEPTLLERAMETIHGLEAKVEGLIHPDAPGNASAGAVESATEAATAELPNVAAVTPPAGAATPASTGNMLVNAAPTVDGPNVAPAADVGAPETGTAPVGDGDVAELPRESHLMLLEAKIAAFRAKLVNQERVALDEFEAIVGHLRAVL